MDRRFKSFAGALAVAVAAVGLQFGALSPASASTTWYVAMTGNNDNTCNSADKACSTINGAIGKASPGDTIYVLAGTYNDSTVNLDKDGLILRGAQAEFAGGASARGAVHVDAESQLTYNGRIFDLNAKNLTIEGFRFTQLNHRGLDSYANPDNLTLRNNYFNVISSNTSGGAIQFGGGANLTANGFVFERNYATGSAAGYLLYMGHSMASGTIQDNYLNSSGFAFGPFGKPDGWVIQRNEFDGRIGGSPHKGYGINAQFGNAIVRGNTFKEMYLGLGQVSIVGGSITGNSFVDNYAGAFQLWGGEYGSPASLDVAIENNFISYNGTTDALDDAGYLSQGFRLRPGNLTDASKIHVHDNHFVNLNKDPTKTQVWAMRNNMTGSVDATENAWSIKAGGTVRAMTSAEIAIAVGKATSDLGSGLGTTSPWIATFSEGAAPTTGGYVAGVGFWPTNIVLDPPAPQPDPPAPGPAPEPTATPTPTPTPEPTPTPTPSQTATLVTTSLPSEQASPPAPPASPLRPGSGSLVINGVSVPVEVAASDDGSTFVIKGAGVTLELSSLTTSGEPLKLAPDGSLLVSQEGPVVLQASGYATGSTVTLWMYSSPLLIGVFPVGPGGAAALKVDNFDGVPAGAHTLQIVGTSSTGSPLMVNVGVTVASEKALTGGKPVVRAKTRTVLSGAKFAVTATGVKPFCAVQFSVKGSTVKSTVTAAGSRTVKLKAPIKPGKYTVTVRVLPTEGCTAAAGALPVTVRAN